MKMICFSHRVARLARYCGIMLRSAYDNTLFLHHHLTPSHLVASTNTRSYQRAACHVPRAGAHPAHPPHWHDQHAHPLANCAFTPLHHDHGPTHHRRPRRAFVPNSGLDHPTGRRPVHVGTRAAQHTAGYDAGMYPNRRKYHPATHLGVVHAARAHTLHRVRGPGGAAHY